MARPPKHDTFFHLLSYHISLYYLMRERSPGIKFKEEEHLKKIESENKKYRHELSKYPEWDTEENREMLKREIDFLTGVYTRQKREQEKKERLASIKKSLFLPTIQK